MIGDLTPEQLLFFALTALMLISGISMINSRHPVYSAVWMVLSMFAVAGQFVLLDSYFLGVIQVLVYAGAIMVLFLFIIMLLNVDLDGSYQPTPSLLAGVLLVVTTVALVVGLVGPISDMQTESGASYFPLPSQAIDVPAKITLARLADSLFYKHWFSFEAVSMLLLAAILGVTVLSKRRLE